MYFHEYLCTYMLPLYGYKSPWQLKTRMFRAGKDMKASLTKKGGCRAAALVLFLISFSLSVIV